MALFAQDFHRDTLKGEEKSEKNISLWDMYQNNLDHFSSQKERDHVNQLLQDINKNLTDIDNLIKQASHSWKINRIFIIDLNIMRLALYEMLYAQPQIPFKVCVDEAVEIAKIYGTENSPDFVNGNLDTIYKKHKNNKKPQQNNKA